MNVSWLYTNIEVRALCCQGKAGSGLKSEMATEIDYIIKRKRAMLLTEIKMH